MTDVEEYATDYIGDQSMQFLEEFDAEDDAAPWAMYVTVSAPHFPFFSADEYAESDVPDWPDNPALREDNLGDKPGFVPEVGFSADDGEAIYEKQLRTLMSADDMVASLFDKLEELDED